MATNFVNPFQLETVWTDKWRVDDAERKFYERLAAVSKTTTAKPVVQQVNEVLSEVRSAVAGDIGLVQTKGASTDVAKELQRLEKENQSLRAAQSQLTSMLKKLEIRVETLERGTSSTGTTPSRKSESTVSASKDDDEDDVDLFGSDDEEDEAAEKLKQERVAAYAAKKAKKPALIAKSSIVLDVKPWEDTTDMVELERLVRTVAIDGLLWGASKLVPVGYGIKKLQIGCVVEDDKVSIDDLEERITAFEDHVQSVDVAAFNKI